MVDKKDEQKNRIEPEPPARTYFPEQGNMKSPYTFIKRDAPTPFVPRTKFYDGFDGFKYDGARPARNPHLEKDDDRGR